MGLPNNTNTQHQRQGQIRKMCKLDCPEYCRNKPPHKTDETHSHSLWEYYDGRYQNHEWYDDRTISINCIGEYIFCSLCNLGVICLHIS